MVAICINVRCDHIIVLKTSLIGIKKGGVVPYRFYDGLYIL